VPSVTVVGGGIAGLTAALRLAERGYEVKLYEAKAKPGGNLGSRGQATGGGPELDVYPHMFQGWYNNFWKLMKDVGKRPEDFIPFTSVYQARRPPKGESVAFAKLTSPYSAATAMENLFSDIASPADMFIFGYASLDLQAELLNPTTRLQNMSLSGYLKGRPYMTPAALSAYEAFVLRVWGIPAYLISALDCRTYGEYCYAAADVPVRLSVGPAKETVIDPIMEALKKTTPPVDVQPHKTVYKVKLKEAGRGVYKAETIWVKATGASDRKGEPVEVHNLVLAVPPATLSSLVRSGKHGERIVDALSGLAELARFGSQRIPVLHLCLSHELANIPKYPVALYGSKLNLAFTDISKLWTGTSDYRNKTALALSCSEPFRLAGPEDDYDAFAMVKELAEYLPFKPGERWGDPSAEIDWSLTHYASNADAQLTLNAIGTDPWRPPATSKQVPNLFVAGDFCRHDFGITTVEAAVATGLAAANGVIAHAKVGEPEEIIPAKKLSPGMFVGMRYAWMAAAYAAMGWSWMHHPAQGRSGDTAWDPSEPLPSDPLEAIIKPSTIRYLLTPRLPARARQVAQPAKAAGGKKSSPGKNAKS
jgi:hypothetical protein